jgi:hypothetical protein
VKGRLDLSIPEAAAEHLLGTIYSTSTVAQPKVPTDLLKSRFLRDGGSLAQYQVGLDFALTKGWLVLNDSGTLAEFSEAGQERYS